MTASRKNANRTTVWRFDLNQSSLRGNAENLASHAGKGHMHMDKALRSKILDVLADCNDMTIATVREDGYPQATVVSYAHDGLTIYFGCGDQSQKAKNIARNSKVSLTVTRPYVGWDTIEGVSIGGIAEPVTDPKEIAQAARLMLIKFPQILKQLPPGVTGVADLKGTRFYRVVPKVISLLDYTKGFGHTDLVTVP
jgi:nitroimidazol reductase NimA-like FMN-containing flavoprotein (pyridoxamine 5'-phosphate oxidase superfamily)